MNVSGRMDVSGNQSTITLNGSWGELELVAAGDGSNSITGGEISSLDIDGKSYSHLRDEMYLGCLRIFSSGELLVSLFDAIQVFQDLMKMVSIRLQMPLLVMDTQSQGQQYSLQMEQLLLKMEDVISIC